MFKILNYQEREDLKRHDLTPECGDFPNICDHYWKALWHRQLDYIYGKVKYCRKTRRDIKYDTYLKDEVKPTFLEYKNSVINQKPQTSYLKEYDKKYKHSKLKKEYIIKTEKP